MLSIYIYIHIILVGAFSKLEYISVFDPIMFLGFARYMQTCIAFNADPYISGYIYIYICLDVQVGRIFAIWIVFPVLQCVCIVVVYLGFQVVQSLVFQNPMGDNHDLLQLGKEVLKAQAPVLGLNVGCNVRTRVVFISFVWANPLGPLWRPWNSSACWKSSKRKCQNPCSDEDLGVQCPSSLFAQVQDAPSW